MEINYLTIIATIVNFALLAAIVVLLYKAVRGIKNFVNRNKEVDKKIDNILNKLEDKKDS